MLNLLSRVFGSENRMGCEAFRAWIDQAGTELVEPMPPALRQHGDTCVDCQTWQQAEAAWGRLFGTMSQTSLTHSLWPGVRARLAHAAPVASLSDELMVVGRLLVPALALLVLGLVGVGWWGGSHTQTIQIDAQEARLASTFLVANPTAELAFLSHDPDTILLQQWGGSETP